jgi:hypothetical protein
MKPLHWIAYVLAAAEATVATFGAWCLWGIAFRASDTDSPSTLWIDILFACLFLGGIAAIWTGVYIMALRRARRKIDLKTSPEHCFECAPIPKKVD